MNRGEEIILEIAHSLEDAGIPYMLAGSVASSLLGEPRGSQDADIVIDSGLGQLEIFLDALGEAYFISREDVQEALRYRSMFNVIHIGEAYKVDLIVRKDRSYSREELRRWIRVPFGDRAIWIAAPEDAILSKLEWAARSGPERQFRDALGVARVNRNALDREYLRKWADELSVADDLERLLSAADAAEPPGV